MQFSLRACSCFERGAYVHITCKIYTPFISFLVPKDAAPREDCVGTKNERWKVFSWKDRYLLKSYSGAAKQKEEKRNETVPVVNCKIRCWRGASPPLATN